VSKATHSSLLLKGYPVSSTKRYFQGKPKLYFKVKQEIRSLCSGSQTFFVQRNSSEIDNGVIN
jgi:hypothetical protein